ncbi:MAG: hypothetical protein WB440_10975 [Steroidobacteraceae bacterium]
MSKEPDKSIGQALVDNLNRNVLAKAKAMEPGADWSELRQGDRVFRLSPDGTQARQLGVDGFWSFVRAEYVREHGTPVK